MLKKAAMKLPIGAGNFIAVLFNYLSPSHYEITQFLLGDHFCLYLFPS
jgi:hypothetical protein